MPDRNSLTWSYSLPAALLLMAPFDILASLAMDIYLPVVPDMPAILGTSPAVVQLTLSLYMLLLGLGQLLFGPLSDRFGRRPVLLGGATLFALASLGLAATTSAPVFVALRLVQAAGASAALVATFATVRDVYGARPEGVTIYGLFSAMLSFVPALGPIAGALISGAFGWRAIFLTLAMLGLAALGQALPQWSETRPDAAAPMRPSFRPMLASGAFWTYTLGFSTAMGAFLVFFSTAPRLLIDRAGYSQLGFSLAFATAAVVMIIATRFARGFVTRYGTSGCLARGMALIILGGLLLGAGEASAVPSFQSFVLPMWVIAFGIVMSASVTANGALKAFDAIAGTAVALYFSIQSLIVSLIGTGAVLLLGGDTAWPLVGYCLGMATITLLALASLNRRENR
ncbi:CmlA/FloR family chloramphenicol efflux MFS transporter [Ensifer adhaerens]|jgi:DHA1 family florfenicol/chloramphenicol resistance protein-like MFS transporter|uniref:CmlA/FloR family chloramphenicol efflux MFS transporter n=1 Tax=Ensifer adhaerens TaxID=106592 RepID=UPI00202E9752|nr:CmlA/FloR family chloramphenicol efflux MFS transporter [Ensifer adhaerens]